MGSMRTPALQTLLLYSSSLDTNTDCSRIVCDSWLEIKFCESQSGEESLSHAVQLRSTWQALIEAKLQGNKPTYKLFEDINSCCSRDVVLFSHGLRLTHNCSF